MNNYLSVIFIALLIGCLNGSVVRQPTELDLSAEQNYEIPSGVGTQTDSELTNRNDGFLSAIGNFVFNFLDKKIFDRFRESPNSESNLRNIKNMSQIMQEMHNSLSTMWRQTVETRLQDLKSLIPNNETLVNLRETYEQSLSQINELQNELMSLWRETNSVISIDNKTLDSIEYNTNDNNNIWQTLKTHYSGVKEKLSSIWNQFNDREDPNNTQTEWLNINSFNVTKLEPMVIEMQQKLNSVYQNLANRIANSFSTYNSNKCKECEVEDEVKQSEVEANEKFRGSLERMNRIQRDVQDLWQSITQNKDNIEIQDSNDNSIRNRAQSVWNNVKNYYSSRGNGSTIEGVVQSATDRVHRIGDYFTSFWNTGSDYLSNTRERVDENRQTMRSMISDLNNHMKDAVNTFADGVQSIKRSYDNFRSDRSSTE